MFLDHEAVGSKKLRELYGSRRLLYIKPVGDESLAAYLIAPSFTPFGMNEQTHAQILCVPDQPVRSYEPGEWRSENAPEEQRLVFAQDEDGFYEMGARRRGLLGTIDILRSRRVYNNKVSVKTEESTEVVKVQVVEYVRERYWNALGYPYTMTVEET